MFVLGFGVRCSVFCIVVWMLFGFLVFCVCFVGFVYVSDCGSWCGVGVGIEGSRVGDFWCLGGKFDGWVV